MHKVTEFYHIEKTVEIVATINGVPETIRIHALRDNGGNYSTRAEIQRRLKVQFAFKNENQHTDDVDVWIDYELPWTSRSTADDAINQALSLGQFT